MLQEPSYQDDENEVMDINDSFSLEAEYCPETFDIYSAPQELKATGGETKADHENIVYSS